MLRESTAKFKDCKRIGKNRFLTPRGYPPTFFLTQSGGIGGYPTPFTESVPLSSWQKIYPQGLKMMFLHQFCIHVSKEQMVVFYTLKKVFGGTSGRHRRPKEISWQRITEEALSS